MSRRSVRARSSQIFAGLITYHNGINDVPPPKYWKTILQSYHEHIDHSYWISLGRGDIYADACFQLQNCLEEWTRQILCDLQNINDGLVEDYDHYRMHMHLFPKVDDNWPPTDMNEGELPIFLHYDPKLLSRWKALFHTIAGSRYWGLFRVKNIELPKILMDEFTTAMDMRTTFFPEEEYSATFDNNNLGSGSILSLSRVINERCLTELNVMNSTIGQLPTISASNNIRKLDLSGCDTGDESICLSTILSTCPNLQELLLNNMPSGVTITNDCLGCNPQLQLLELKWNHLSDEDGEVLAASLGNANLETLSLHGNSFSEVSEDAFAKAICNDEDLNAVIDSNHTCTVRGVTEEIEGLQCPIEEKKFRSLKPNGASFIDVPLGLMPMVLAWLQSAPRHGSTAMFDALRTYWDLPSLLMGRHQPEEVKMCLRDMISTISNEEMVCGQSFHQASLPPRKHGEYDIVLPRTNQGLLLNVGENTLLTLSNRELALLNIGETGNELNHTLFLGYRRFPDGSKGLPEIFTLVKEHGDIITAVNGISIVGKSFKEGIPLLKVNLPFLHMRLQSRRSILRPFHESAYSEYSKSYDLSVKLKHQVTEMQNKYDGLIMSQNEEVQEGCDKSERLKRLHAREQAGIKNDLQQARDTFAAAERNRGKTWSQLTEIRDHLR